MKPAKIGSGIELQVAAFCEIGDQIEIDTRTGEFKRRVNALMILRETQVTAKSQSISQAW